MANIKQFIDLNGNSTPFQGIQIADATLFGTDSNSGIATAYDPAVGFELSTGMEFSLDAAYAGLTIILRVGRNWVIDYPATTGDIAFNVNGTGVLKAYKGSTALTTANFHLDSDKVYLLNLYKYQAGGGSELYEWQVYEVVHDAESVAANPSASATADLEKLKVGGTVYDIPSGVEANPAGSPTQTLSTVDIGGTVYELPGSISGTTDALTTAQLNALLALI